MRILIAGDFCPYYRIEKMVADANFSFFDEIKNFTESVDYSIINFECPVIEGNVKPISKCGPALRTEKNAVSAIKYAGFDCVTLANNHFRDFGDIGCLSTIQELKAHSIDYVGGGESLAEAQSILYKEIQGKRIAFINFCENEFSIATDNTAGAAPLDSVDNYYQITKARENSDYVVVIVHGGHEYYQLPSPRMKKLYRFFLEIGADVVVNHHQHCYSGYEFYKGKPIVYGLGNFCFDWKGERNSIWNEGYMLLLKFDRTIQIDLIPYKQCDAVPNIKLLSTEELNIFNSSIETLNNIINNDKRLMESFTNWCDRRNKSINSLFRSYHNRYLNAAAARGWISHPKRASEIKKMLNYIMCESHRDITIKILTDSISKE